MWLWMVTAAAGAIAGGWFAARIAYRLTGDTPGRRYAPIVGAAFAAVGVLALQDFYQLILIGNVDPLIMTLTLAAVDAHLSKRPRLAFAALVLAALGRPEAWPFAGLYAVRLWRQADGRRTRAYALAGVAVIPLLWFGIPALTSHSWFISGDLALNSKNALHGSKFSGVVDRFFGLSEWPMNVAIGLALVLAAIRRDRTGLALAGAAVLWVAIEIAFAYHGWSAVARYMLDPPRCWWRSPAPASGVSSRRGSARGCCSASPDPRPRLRSWSGSCRRRAQACASHTQRSTTPTSAPSSSTGSRM